MADQRDHEAVVPNGAATTPSRQLSGENYAQIPSLDSSRTGVWYYLSFVIGTVKPLSDWVSGKPLPLRFLNACVRALGQPLFANNPYSGLLILAGLFVQSPWRTVCGLVALISAQLTATILKLDREGTDNGAYSFNGLLTGFVIATLSASGDWYGYLVFPVIFFGIFSAILSSALSSLLAGWNLPAFNLAFNVSVVTFVAATGPSNAHFPQTAASGTAVAWGVEAIDWLEILASIPRGIAQCYGSDSLITGCLMSVGMLVCSPIVFFHALLGSVLGSLTGLALAATPADIYNGSWGYNSALTGAAVGGVFYVLNWSSHLMACFAALFAAAVRGAMANFFASSHVPVLAFPFCIAAGLFLLVDSKSKQLLRVPSDRLTCPEEHRRLFKTNNVTAINVAPLSDT